MTEKKKQLYFPMQYILDELFPDISRDSIVRLIERGEIPAIRLTNKYFIPAWWIKEKIDFATIPPKN